MIGVTQKKTAIDQQQHSCETLIYERHQTILRFLSTAATASTQWRVRELYCQASYVALLGEYFEETPKGQTNKILPRWPFMRYRKEENAVSEFCKGMYKTGRD
jgi:hypothetical protein